jgi:hypothetical protein
MTQIIPIPIREHDGHKWGALALLQNNHEIVGYTFNRTNENYSFIGGHRVRLYKVSGNVHFKIPKAVFDITAVKVNAPVPASAPRRQDKRHNKGK